LLPVAGNICAGTDLDFGKLLSIFTASRQHLGRGGDGGDVMANPVACTHRDRVAQMEQLNDLIG
jgi:hypothetical protein